MTMNSGIRNTLFLCVALAVPMPRAMTQPAQPAVGATLQPSAELNRALPKWLRFSGDYRARLEGFEGGGFKLNNGDEYLLSRLRLNLQIKPMGWLRVFGQAQDSRVVWKNQHPAAPPFQNTWDIRQAYVEIGNIEKQHFSIRTGRQELNIGDERLVGSSNWTNTARSFDAVRASMHYKGYRLDAFASSVVIARDGQWDHRKDGNNLHGLVGGIEKLVPQAVIEPYLFWRLAPGQKTEAGKLAKLDSKTTGVRWVGKLRAHFDYNTDLAVQTGHLGTDRVRAWAGHANLGYTWAARFTPRMFAEYNYASGDKNPHDAKRGTFDQLYPTAHNMYGLADQVGWRNIIDLRTGVSIKPRQKWTASGTFHSWWLASIHDALYNAAGAAIARVANGAVGSHVGEELDGQAMYAVNKLVQVGVGFGHIFPGEFLKRATPGKAYNFPFLMAGYTF